MDKRKFIAALGLVAAGFIGGVAPLFARSALVVFSPFAIVFLRMLLSSLILLTFTFYSGKLKWPRRDLISVIISGLLFSGNIVFFTYGIGYTTAFVSQVLYLFNSLIVLLLQWLFLRIPIRRYQILGVGLGMAGVALLLSKSLSLSELSASLGTFKGNALVLTAVLSWGSYLVFSQKFRKEVSPLTQTANNSVVGTFILLPVFMVQVFKGTAMTAPLNPGAVGGVLALVIINSIIVFMLFQWGIRHLSAFAASVASYFSPVSAGLVGVLFLNENFSLQLVASTVLIVIGSYINLIYPQIRKRRVAVPVSSS